MPVPSWTAIPDSMVAPEAPVSSDLMTRLRDQWASFLGVDPTSVTQPPFALPASYQKVETSDFLSATGGLGATITTGEALVATIADDVEDIQVSNFQNTAYDNTGRVEFDTLSGNFLAYKSSATTVGPNAAIMTAMSVDYTAGAPVSMTFWLIQSDGSFVSTTVTANNTYQTILTVGSITLEAKVRLTSTQVFLTLRSPAVSASHHAEIRLPFVTKSFQSKA